MGHATFCFNLNSSPQIVSAGEDVETLLGFLPENFLAAKIDLRSRIHPEDSGLAESLFSPEDGETSGSANLRIRHADGRIRCFKVRYTKERAPKGPLQLAMFLEDARKVSEPGDARLIASFKSLIEDTSDYIYIKNRNHVILAASRSLTHLTESAHHVSELVGKTDYDLHPETVADSAYRLETLAFTEGMRTNEIQQIVTQDGARKWIDNRKYPINGPDGTIIGILGIAPEITQYMEATEKLRLNEESLRETQEIAGIGSYTLDIPAMTWQLSPEVYTLLGIDSSYDRTFEGIWPLVHPDERGLMADRFKACLAGKMLAFDSDYRMIRHTDGAIRWVLTRGRVELDAQGKPLAIRGTVQDITEKKQAEAALRESEESLREAQRIAGFGSYTLDIPSQKWTCSEIMNEIFGIDGAYEHTTEKWLDLVHPGDRAAINAYFRDEVVGQGKPFDKEYRIIRHSDGVERWVSGRGEIGFDLHGRPVKMYGTIKDITERKQAELALCESKELLQLFIDHAPAAMAMFDREMRYLATSRRWLEMYALGNAEIVGRLHYEVFPAIPESWREEHRRCLAGEKVEASERKLTLADGSLRWMWREILPWRTGDGCVGGLMIITEDITERKKAEERLRLAAKVFTGAREGITITDPKGTILDVNDAFTRITGYSREEVVGQNSRILKSGLQSEDFYQNMWDCLLRDGQWSGDIWNRTKDGDIYPEALNIHAIYDAAGEVKQYVGLFTDITEEKHHEEQLEYIARYDVLTELPNRALFVERLRQAMAQARRSGQLVGVVYLDLDNFKAINDGYGQSSGDALLAALAFRMRRALREGDTLARLGGDEFAAVILDPPNRDACLLTLSQMLAAATKMVQVGDEQLQATASAGVAFYPQAEEIDADTLLRQASQALYTAKLAGKNRFHVFDPSQDLITRKRNESIEQVRRALSANELVLHYQPKVNMRTGKVIGAEALLRWQHPERGLLPPGLFLPEIENHPLMIEIGEWVIENVLTQMEAWQEKGFEISVSVNVSAFELQQPDFFSRLCERLSAHPRVDPSRLELEVLETSALQNVLQSSQVLAACRELGVMISVDDFGTGYSSLAYLKRLPANVLKIDESFVRDMLDDPENLTILKGIVGLAEAFRWQVIAEGVETVDHGLMLLQLGCDCAQGYAIAKAMPAWELPAWATAWRADPRWGEVPVVHASNRMALFAAVEHRAWYGHFMAYLQGTRLALRSIDDSQCGISEWIESQRLSSGSLPISVQAIETIHRQLHALAAEIHAAHASGHKQDALGLLRQLRYLHDRCLRRLQPFMRVPTQKLSVSIAD